MERPENPKVGDKFVVIENSCFFNKGDIVQLVEDDFSKYPYFGRVNNKDMYACHWTRLEPYTETKQQWKTITNPSEIKQYPVGTKVRINGQETKISGHFKYLDDYRFYTENDTTHFWCNWEDNGNVFAACSWEDERNSVEVLIENTTSTVKKKRKKKQQPTKRIKADTTIYYRDGSQWTLRNSGDVYVDNGAITIVYNVVIKDDCIITGEVSTCSTEIVEKVVSKTPKGVDTIYFK